MSRSGLPLLALLVSACTPGYMARLNPPEPEPFTSMVAYAEAYAGGKPVSTAGVRSVRARMCGVVWGTPRKQLYLTNAAQLCARQGGHFEAPMCEAPGADTALFMATVKDTPSADRTCQRELEDFYVLAAEPEPGITREAFTAKLAADGYKTARRTAAEAAAREQAEQARRAQFDADYTASLERQRLADIAMRERRRAAGIEFRKTLRVGVKTNCGPVLEMREDLVKVYFPLAGYGNEHWLERNTVFPASEDCEFRDGRYLPPR